MRPWLESRVPVTPRISSIRPCVPLSVTKRVRGHILELFGVCGNPRVYPFPFLKEPLSFKDPRGKVDFRKGHPRHPILWLPHSRLREAMGSLTIALRTSVGVGVSRNLCRGFRHPQLPTLQRFRALLPRPPVRHTSRLSVRVRLNVIVSVNGFRHFEQS